MLHSVVQIVHGLVGRPRKHGGGWECMNKRICIADEMFKNGNA